MRHGYFNAVNPYGNNPMYIQHRESDIYRYGEISEVALGRKRHLPWKMALETSHVAVFSAENRSLYAQRCGKHPIDKWGNNPIDSAETVCYTEVKLFPAWSGVSHSIQRRQWRLR